MKKKKIIRFSIIMIIFLVIFGIVFLINSLNKNNNIDYQEPKPEVIPYEMEPVKEYSYFFSVVNILNNYLNYIHDKNNEALMQILHPEYIDFYSIDNNNLYDYLGDFGDNLQVSFKAKMMTYKIYDDNNYLYYVKGDIIGNNFEDSKVVFSDAMFLVNIDYDNVTYAIYPLDYRYEVLPIEKPEKKISLNNYNELVGSNIITKDFICSLYLNDFIDKINNNEDTYYLLSDDFRRKQYPKKDNYLSFMANNKDKLNYQVYSCSSLSGTSHVYEVKDMNFNSYTFIEESIMNYKVEFTIK